MSSGPQSTRPLLIACLVGSAVVHAGTLGVLAFYKPPTRDRITDAPEVEESTTLLTLAAKAPAPIPQAEPPPPAPKPEPKPEVKPPEPLKVVAPTPRSIIAYAPVPPPRVEAPVERLEPIHATPVRMHTEAARTNPVDVPRGTPVATFAGVQAKRAGRIVYAVDASGAMASSLPFVLDEVMRSVNRLQPTQSFQVVLFRESPDGSTSMSPLIFGDTLEPATEENRSKLAAWLHGAQPAGRSNPLSGLEPALALQPDLIFLLTRSIKRSGPQSDWGPGNRAVLQRLDQLNPRDNNGNRRVVIKTIQFLDADPTGLLQAIADSHGDGPGSCRTLELDELEAR